MPMTKTEDVEAKYDVALNCKWYLSLFRLVSRPVLSRVSLCGLCEVHSEHVEQFTAWI